MHNASTTTLGRLLKDTYRVDDYLGEGGPSIVYKGTDVLLDVPVAIKRLKTGLPLRSGHTTAQRFLREARTQARLHHQNIVGIRAMHEEGEDTFIVMEFVQGVDLHEYIGFFPNFQLPLNEILFIFEHALAGLGFAHKHSVIHRDIKPSNILLGEGLVVKLADFGIARALDDHKLTQTGALLGTLLYISPEQLRGETADQRADVYSMGISLYEAVVGHTPFARHSDEIQNGYELLSRHLFTPPEPPSTFRPEIPEALNQVILQSIEKKADDRFPDCHHFAQALRSALFPHVSPLKQWSKPLKRAAFSPESPDPIPSPPPAHRTPDPMGYSPQARGTQTVHPTAPSPHAQPTPPPKYTTPTPYPPQISAINTLDPSPYTPPDLAPPQRRTQTAPALSSLPSASAPSPLPFDPIEIPPPFPSGDDFQSPHATQDFASPPPSHTPITEPPNDPEMQTILDDQLSAEQIRQHHGLFYTPHAHPTHPAHSASSTNAHAIHPSYPPHPSATKSLSTSAHHPSSPFERFEHASALSTSEMQRIALSADEMMPSNAHPTAQTRSASRRSFGRIFAVLFGLIGLGALAWWYIQPNLPINSQPQPESRQATAPHNNTEPRQATAPHNNTEPRDTPHTTTASKRLSPQPSLQTPTAPLQPRTRNTQPRTNLPISANIGPQIALAKGMVWIPNGWFWQGKEQHLKPYPKRSKQRILHHPLRKVYISGFWIDRTEVTVGAYRACVEANRCADIEVAFSSQGKRLPVKRSVAHSFPPEEPMRFVTWKEALTFCRWQQKRLPTEAEWEYAARGNIDHAGPKQRFSWQGDAITCQHAVHKGCAKQPRPAHTPHERSLGKSPFGVVDLLGNVWEWVQDCYHPDAARYTPPTDPVYDLPNCKRRVLRGGSFLTNKNHPELTVYHQRHTAPNARRDENGFRCAYTPRRNVPTQRP